MVGTAHIGTVVQDAKLPSLLKLTSTCSPGGNSDILNIESVCVSEVTMALSKENLVQELARLVGITLAEEELSEVGNRFESLILELDRLKELDLSDVQPVTTEPGSSGHSCLPYLYPKFRVP